MHLAPRTARRVLAGLCLVPTLAAAPRAQQSAQLFDAPVIVAPGSQQRMNALLDLNDDGWMDAVGTFWKTSEEVAVFGFVNDGAGRLEPAFEVAWGHSGSSALPFPIATADLNNDGLEDFVTGVRTSLTVFLSNGTATPTRAPDVQIGSGREVQDLVLGDYDGDGDIEAAVRTLGDQGIRIYRNLAQAPTLVASLLPASNTGLVLKNADADGDGIIDLVCIGSRVSYFALRNGVLTALDSFSMGLAQGTGGDSGDIDGDGDADVVVFDMGGHYRVLRRLGPSQFLLEDVQTGGPATGLADIDGDGDLDGVCCSTGGGATTYVNSARSHFEISINDGTGSFAAAFPLLSMGANEIAGVTDIDHDGDADLIAGRVIRYNVGGFAPGPFEGLPELTTYVPPFNLRDADGDGDSDAPLTFDLVAKNRGNGELVSASRIMPPPPPGSTFDGAPVQADFDGDGDIDVIVREKRDGALLHERMLWNTGGGGLVDGGPVTVDGVVFQPGAVGWTWVGDLNGDARLDLVAGYFDTRIFLRAETGRFLLSAALPELPQALADLDADGYDDLVTQTPNEWRIRFGAPTPEQSVLITLPAGPSYLFAGSMDVGDLDDDGDLDLVGSVGTLPQKSLRLLENLGERAFAVHDDVLPPFVGAALPVIVADCNDDGALDVMVGQRFVAASNSYVYGSATFLGSPAPGLDFTPAGAETYPLLVGLVDFDGDGDLEGWTGRGLVLNHARGRPQTGWHVQYGNGTPGGGGQVPTLSAVGPFVPGSSVEFRITGAAPNRIGALLIGLGTGTLPLPAYGAVLQNLPLSKTVTIHTVSPTNQWGSGRYSQILQLPLSLLGVTHYYQALIFDPAAHGGLSFTNPLEVHYAE